MHVLVPGRRRVRSQPGTAIHHGTVAGHDVETLHDLQVLAIEPAMAEVLCRGKSPVTLECLARYPPDLREHVAVRVAARIRARADPRGRRRALTLLSGAYRLAG
nr:hypothetical protein [Kibdelosporangium sp. MJ126-NF4]CTQ92973.1 hypothetical protein [Kibdelosporangium sp. MJ126-NF4]